MRRITVLFVSVLLAIMMIVLIACNRHSGNDIQVDHQTKVFYSLSMNEVAFVTNIEEDEFITISGANIASGDFSFMHGILSFSQNFLQNLMLGEHAFTIYTTKGEKSISIEVHTTKSSYLIDNNGFETGDLTGWLPINIFKNEDNIQSFINEGVKDNTTFFTFNALYNGTGQYVYGFDDRDGLPKDQWNERMGRLQSSTFTLSGSGIISFKLGGGKNTALSYLSIKRVSDDYEIARFGNHVFHSTTYFIDDTVVINPDYFEANLVQYYTDLSAHLNQSLYIEITDMGGRDWDLLTFDSFYTYYETEPTFDNGHEAIDIKPNIVSEPLTSNLINGQFDDELNGWTSPQDNTFWVDNGILKSNLEGDPSIGIIRSSAFQLNENGSGWISFALGAAKGSRFDKDTFISIRELHTNIEIARYANTRHDGTLLITYYADLSAYRNKMLYIEIVDNAQNAWDTIFVDQIITDYASTPSFSQDQIADNLNY